jgi:hypothetical protein
MSTETIVALLERELQCIMPSDYRAFLVAPSVLVTEPVYVTCDIDDAKETISWPLRDIYDPREQCEGVSFLVWLHRIVAARKYGEGLIPEGALVIGGVDPREDVILFVSGSRRGQVWLKLRYRVEQYGIDEPEDSMYFLARSFTEFLAGLTSEPQRRPWERPEGKDP